MQNDLAKLKKNNIFVHLYANIVISKNKKEYMKTNENEY